MKLKKPLLFAEKPNPMQNEHYCFFCGGELKYLWFKEGNEFKRLMSQGCNLTMYCDKCKQVFQPNVYSHLTVTDLKDYFAEIK